MWNKSGAYPFGDEHYAIGVSARTTIKRSDFGMTYALAGDLVGDEVEIILEFEAIRQPPVARLGVLKAHLRRGRTARSAVAGEAGEGES